MASAKSPTLRLLESPKSIATISSVASIFNTARSVPLSEPTISAKYSSPSLVNTFISSALSTT